MVFSTWAVLMTVTTPGAMSFRFSPLASLKDKALEEVCQMLSESLLRFPAALHT